MAADTNNLKHKELLSGLFASGEYADLTITCNGHTFSVHKNVVCPQSTFFKKACKKNTFKEGESGVIDLPEDDPFAVKAMLEFLYLAKYTADGDETQWLLHAKVASLADKYDIQPLKNAAHNYLQKGSDEPPSNSEFAVAVKWTYENTETSDKGRDIMVSLAVKHFDHLISEEEGEFFDMMAEVGAFSRDLAKANRGEQAASKDERGNYHYCPQCESHWMTKELGGNCSFCPKCVYVDELKNHPCDCKWECRNCKVVLFSSVSVHEDGRLWDCPHCHGRGFMFRWGIGDH